MGCPICGNKPANCDCTDSDRKAHDMDEMVYRLRHAIAHLGDIATDALLSGRCPVGALEEIQNIATEYLDNGP